MRNIHVVIDSTANAPAEFREKYKNLHKVSLKLMIGEREWDEDEVSCAMLFEEMRHTDVFPRTSQPPIGAFVETFRPIVASGGQVIVLTVSGGLSGTVEGARTAARMVDEKNIKVIDTETAAAGIVNIARQALAMIDEDVAFDEIIGKLEKAILATHTLLLTDSLEYLHKGGRIGGAQAVFGTLLQIKPILKIVKGKIAVFDKVRTRSRAIARMTEEVGRHKNLFFIGIVHSGAEEECLTIRRQLAEVYPEAEISVNEVSSGLAIHVGPRALAFMYQENLK